MKVAAAIQNAVQGHLVIYDKKKKSYYIDIIGLFYQEGACVLCNVWLFVTLWTVAHQAPLSIGFSRQEFWSGLPFPTPGGLPDLGIQPLFPVSPELAGGFLTIEPPGKPLQENTEN